MYEAEVPCAEASQDGTQTTGDARVEIAMARLAGLAELPLAAQVTVFDDVHRLLQDALSGAHHAATAQLGASTVGASSSGPGTSGR